MANPKPAFKIGEEVKIKGIDYVVIHTSWNDESANPTNFTYELQPKTEVDAMIKLSEDSAAAERQKRDEATMAEREPNVSIRDGELILE